MQERAFQELSRCVSNLTDGQSQEDARQTNWTTNRAPNWSLPVAQLGPSVPTVTASCSAPGQDEEPGMSFHDEPIRTRQDDLLREAAALILARPRASRPEGRAL